MLNVINRHKGLSIVLGLSFILFIIMFFIFISLFKGNGNGKYGNRLEGIDDVKLSNLSEVESSLKDNENIVDANVRLQGKIVYVTFEVNSDVSLDSAKEIASSTLSSFNEDELAFYDFSYLVKWTNETDEGSEVAGIAGTKHHGLDSITWSKS